MSMYIHLCRFTTHCSTTSSYGVVRIMHCVPLCPQGTFMLLLQGYCQQGNIAGSTAILEHMKAEEFPINEHAYAALITGHARSGDLSSAEQMLDMMREREVEPTIVSYTSLMCAQAEAGDMEAIRRVRAGHVVAVCALCSGQLSVLVRQ